MPDDLRLYPDPKPDRFTLVVRGVCGAVLGAVLGGGLWLRVGGMSPRASIVLIAASVVVCAWGAIRHGDDFWHCLLGRR